jgi:hypothetical protein
MHVVIHLSMSLEALPLLFEFVLLRGRDEDCILDLSWSSEQVSTGPRDRSESSEQRFFLSLLSRLSWCLEVYTLSLLLILLKFAHEILI